MGGASSSEQVRSDWITGHIHGRDSYTATLQRGDYTLSISVREKSWLACGIVTVERNGEVIASRTVTDVDASLRFTMDARGDILVRVQAKTPVSSVIRLGSFEVHLVLERALTEEERRRKRGAAATGRSSEAHISGASAVVGLSGMVFLGALFGPMGVAAGALIGAAVGGDGPPSQQQATSQRRIQ